MGRRPCCEKVGLKRGGWTPSEDEILKAYITANGEGKWRDLPKRAGLKRCGKSCRLRWLNYLNPTIKRGNMTPEEEDVIITLHKHVGNRWSFIAARLPGRTDNEIKNYWNTILYKKVQGHHHSSSAPPKRKPRKKSNNQNKSTHIPLVVPPMTIPTQHSSRSQENSTQFMDEMIQDIMDTEALQCLDNAMTDLGSGNNCAEDIDACLQFLINMDINTLGWDEDILACQDMSSGLAFSSDDSTFDYWREIFEFASMDTMSESQQWLCDW